MDAPRQDFGDGALWDAMEPVPNRPIVRTVSASLTGSIAERTSMAHIVGIFDEINRLSAKSRMLFGRVRTGTGLTGTEAMTLVAVVHSSAPRTVAQVGRFLGNPRQVIQRAIKVLERGGFIAVSPNPDHKRASLLTATDKGRSTVARIDAATRQIADDLADGFDVEQLGATHEGLLVLREQVDRTLGVENP